MSRTANPLQGDKGPQGPTAEQLIGLVDSETSRMLAAQAREGWTTWALLLGLAALGWTLFGVLQFSSVNWRAALETFLVASLALDGSLTLLSLLFFRDPQSLSASNRFQFASRFYGNRLVILFAFFRAIALLVIGLDLRHQASLGGAWAVCLFYGFWALFFAFVLIWDFILIPFQFIPNHSRAFAALLLSLGLVSLYAAFSYGLPLISGQGSAGIPECRLATIALAFLYLVRKLAAKAKDSDSLTSLIEIRRNLTLGTISVSDATYQVDVILTGLTVPEVFKNELLGLFLNFARQRAECQAVEQQLSELGARLPPNDTPLDQGQAVLAGGILHSAGIRQITINSLIQESKKIQRVLRRRVAWLPKKSPLVQADVSRMMTYVDSSAGELDARIKANNESISALSLRVQSAKIGDAQAIEAG